MTQPSKLIKYYKFLIKNTGATEDAAEAEAEALASVFETIATKEELIEVKKELKLEIVEVKKELTNKIDKLSDTVNSMVPQLNIIKPLSDKVDKLSDTVNSIIAQLNTIKTLGWFLTVAIIIPYFIKYFHP